MTAPALIALSRGSTDPRCARTAREIVSLTRTLRPGLPVEVAFLDHRRPPLVDAVRRLAGRGVREAVIVPLAVSPYDDHGAAEAAVAEADAAVPSVAVRTSTPLGPDPSLLGVLDARLRAALRSAHVRELDALVLAAVGSPDTRANEVFARLARTWGNRHRLPTKVAFASTSPPSTGEAVRALRWRGRRHVAVGSLFLTEGDLTRDARDLALEAGAVAVSEPLGAHEEVSRLLVARYSVGAFQLVDIPA